MNEKIFSKNQVVFREGEQGTTFYQITAGTAGVYLHYGEAGQQKLTEMKPGQYIGEMSVIGAWPRSATIVAEGELRAIELSGNDLIRYFEEQPDRIVALINQLGDRLRSLTADYDEVQAFIREKESAAVQKKEGFLARLKKYREIAALTNKLVGCTVEDQIIQQGAEKAVLPVQSYAKGQVIFREGDEGLCMYQIHGGSVDIYSQLGTSREEKLTTLYTNAFFGEMGLVGKEKRSASAVVAEDNTVLEPIRAEDLEALFKANPLKVDMILGHLAKRLRRLTVDYAEACAKAGEGA